MATNQFVVVFAIAAVLLPTLAVATDYIVGDDKGWNITVDYAAWAKGKVFHIGDTLVFKYANPPHNVHAVDGASFGSCTSQGTGLTTGNDRITLDTPGKRWYICTHTDHCDRGQKLVIDVDATPAPVPAPNAAFSLTGASSFHVLAAAMLGVATVMFLV